MSAQRYSIEYLPAAVKKLRKLDRSAQDRVTRVIALLADTPRPPNAIPLVGGSGAWRVRTGDYRIIYEIHDDVLLVLVVRVAHRSTVYR